MRTRGRRASAVVVAAKGLLRERRSIECGAMNPEIRNLTNLAKHSVRCAGRGRFGEAAASVAVFGIRVMEAAAEVGAPSRVTCPYCGWSGRRFKTFTSGTSWRAGAVCPLCLSLERHRESLSLFLRLRPVFPPRIRVLDIAPSRAFREWCGRRSDVDYVSFDKVSALAMVKGDLQYLPFRSGMFDIVLCSHVLDYLPDDRLGMREIGRVMAPDGVAILEHNFLRDRPTEEWHAPRRDALDRVRQYGADLPDRFREAGLVPNRVGVDTEVFLAF